MISRILGLAVPVAGIGIIFDEIPLGMWLHRGAGRIRLR
jgi:hypothetical protein